MSQSSCKYQHLHFGEALDLVVDGVIVCITCKTIIYESGVPIPVIYLGHAQMGAGRVDAFRVAGSKNTCPMLLCGEILEEIYEDCGSGGLGFSLAEELFSGMDAVAETPVEVREWLKEKLEIEEHMTLMLERLVIARRLSLWVRRSGR